MSTPSPVRAFDVPEVGEEGCVCACEVAWTCKIWHQATYHPLLRPALNCDVRAPDTFGSMPILPKEPDVRANMSTTTTAASRACQPI